MRNRTNAYKALDAMEGTHRIVIRDEGGRIYCIFECPQYGPAYRATLEKFVMAARMIECGAKRNWLPCTWEHEFNGQKVPH